MLVCYYHQHLVALLTHSAAYMCGDDVAWKTIGLVLFLLFVIGPVLPSLIEVIISFSVRSSVLFLMAFFQCLIGLFPVVIGIGDQVFTFSIPML